MRSSSCVKHINNRMFIMVLVRWCK